MLPDGAQRYVAAFTNEILLSDLDVVEISWRRLGSPQRNRLQAIVRLWLPESQREHGKALEILVGELAEHRAPDSAGRTDARRILEHIMRAASVAPPSCDTVSSHAG